MTGSGGRGRNVTRARYGQLGLPGIDPEEDTVIGRGRERTKSGTRGPVIASAMIPTGSAAGLPPLEQYTFNGQQRGDTDQLRAKAATIREEGAAVTDAIRSLDEPSVTPTQVWVRRLAQTYRPLSTGQRGRPTINQIARYRNDKEFADDCIATFLACSESAMVQARGDTAGYDGASSKRTQQMARRAWAGMQQARLFMIRPETWASSHTAANEFVRGAIEKGLTWELGQPKTELEHEAEARVEDFYVNEGTSWAFPDPMPFSSCFFAYGTRLALTGGALSSRLRDPDLARRDVRLVGNLLVWEGDTPYAFAFLQIAEIDGDQNIGILMSYENGEWFQPASLDPWILNSIIRQINSHGATTQNYAPTLANKLDKRKQEKRARTPLPLPAPYYLISLKDELITPQQMAQHRVGGAGRLVEWSHRWDVRAHEAVRVQRGRGTLDAKERAKLVKRGYHVYEGESPLSAKDAERLTKRNIAPAQRIVDPETGITTWEWIAVLGYWVPACVKGPSDRPYVPGARIDT